MFYRLNYFLYFLGDEPSYFYIILTGSVCILE